MNNNDNRMKISKLQINQKGPIFGYAPMVFSPRQSEYYEDENLFSNWYNVSRCAGILCKVPPKKVDLKDMLAMHNIEEVRQLQVYDCFSKGKKLNSLKEMDNQYSDKIVMDYLKVRSSGKNSSFYF